MKCKISELEINLLQKTDKKDAKDLTKSLIKSFLISQKYQFSIF